MVTKKEKVKVKTKEEKKPQYIENLMKAANKRKIENERRIERQVSKGKILNHVVISLVFRFLSV